MELDDESQQSSAQALGATSLNEDRNALLNPDLIEELIEWHRSENPASAPLKLGRTQPRRGSTEFSNLLRVATENFTRDLIRERMPGALKIPVLYTGPPAVDPTNANNGSFGRVCAVRLPRESKVEGIHYYITPMCWKFTFSHWQFLCTIVTDDHTREETTWTISNVAVKQVLYYGNLPEYRQCARVVREARIWNRMRHKNIVPLLGLWIKFSSESPFPAFVSPWFDEGNLKYFLDQNKNVSSLQRLSFICDIVSALSYMHNHEFKAIHGDLRADNVLVRNFSAYLVDFGISRLDDETRGFSTQPMDQNPRYIARERIFNPSGDDDALKPTTLSDIYEFGSVFLEIWTGDIPWHEERLNAIIYLKRYNRETPPRPSNMDDDMWHFIQRCLATDKHSRPTAEECLRTVVGLKLSIESGPA